MISPELLKRYPFFAPFTIEQLREIAMITNDATAAKGEILFEECQHTDLLYLLLEGSVDLFYTVKPEGAFAAQAGDVKELLVGEINPGEIFGISALIDPYVLSATGRAAKACRFMKIDARGLRDMFAKEPLMGYFGMQQVAKALVERLNYTRVQLAAAWNK
jgi:CRP-like cAMP-binding protein